MNIFLKELYNKDDSDIIALEEIVLEKLYDHITMDRCPYYEDGCYCGKCEMYKTKLQFIKIIKLLEMNTSYGL